MSQLVFYQEDSLLSYSPHTRVDQPHGSHVDLVLHLPLSQQFLSTGSDNHFRLWHQTQQTLPSRVSSDQPASSSVWTCKFKGNYKNLPIYQVVELSSTQLVLSLKNTIVLWDLSVYKATLSFNLNNSPASRICLLDSTRLLVYDSSSVYVLDLAQQ